MEVSKSLRQQADVALRMTKQLLTNEKKNMVFSPLSLTVALGVMAAGSEGRTLQELLSFLRSDSIDGLSELVSDVLSDADRLCFANGMWAHHSLSLSHSFKQLVATHYKANLSSVDFRKGDQVRREVNSWVEKETNGLITDLLPPEAVTNSTRLIFANALHFKSAWEDKFDASQTIDSNFNLLSGTSVNVPFMKSTKDHHFIKASNGFKVLRLPYKQGSDKKRRFSMYIFLPNAKDGLLALIQNLASEPGFLKDKLFPHQKVPVRRFMVPKFKISFAFEASHMLKELGVVSPFSPCDANFTKMAPSNELYVEHIFHKASIDVNEEDTEASAATAVLSKPKGFPSSYFNGTNFVADHPFLFMIREDFTGTILFVGQVFNPLDGAAEPLKSCIADDKPEVQPKRKWSSKDNHKPEIPPRRKWSSEDDHKPEIPPRRKRSSKDDHKAEVPPKRRG